MWFRVIAKSCIIVSPGTATGSLRTRFPAGSRRW